MLLYINIPVANNFAVISGDAGVIQLSKVFTSCKKTSVLNTFDLR